MSTPTVKELGKLVRQQRKARGLTQQQLGELTGMSERSLISLEKGSCKGIRYDKLCAVLQAMGITLDYFIEDVPVQVPVDAAGEVSAESAEQPKIAPVVNDAQALISTFLEEAAAAATRGGML